MGPMGFRDLTETELTCLLRWRRQPQSRRPSGRGYASVALRPLELLATTQLAATNKLSPSTMPLTLAVAQQNARSLYRHILRAGRQLEPDTREFYRHIARSTQVGNGSSLAMVRCQRLMI